MNTFKQSHKRSKREDAAKRDSYIHKPRKERQAKLDAKHELTCQLWKIKRSKARETKEYLSQSSQIILPQHLQIEVFEDSKAELDISYSLTSEINTWEEPDYELLAQMYGDTYGIDYQDDDDNESRYSCFSDYYDY